MRTRRSPALAVLGFLIPIAACTDVATAPTTPPAIDRPQMARATRSITMTNLGTLGGAGDGEARAINSSGQIVGYSQTIDGNPHAFLWEKGSMIDLGTLGGRESFALDINDAGEAVGYSATSNGEYHAFLWKDGVMTELNQTAGYLFSSAVAINAAGQIVGTGSSGSNLAGVAMLWTRGRLSTLPGLSDGPTIAEAINPAGDIVGLGENADGYNRAILWRRGEPIDLGTLGGASAWALDINPAGVVVGLSATSDDISHAYRWRAGKMTDLGTLGGWTSIANSINPAGQIVGASDASDNTYHAVLWQGDEILDLGTPLVYSTALGISPRGQAVGSARMGPDSENPGPLVPVLWTIK